MKEYLVQSKKSILFTQLKTFQIYADCRYLQDCIVNGVKSEQNNLLFPEQCIIRQNTVYFRINLKQKKIINWSIGTRAKTFFKVCDGFRGLIYSNDNILKLSYKTNYVPANLDFNGDSYGDYLQFEIDQNGYILNWNDEIFYYDMKNCDYEIV